MSRSFFRMVGTWLTAGSATLAAGSAAVGQEVLPPTPATGVVVEVAEGDVFAVAPQVHTLTLSADGLVGNVAFFAHPVSDDPSSLLEMDNVQKELDLLDDQKERIREAQRQMHDGMQRHFTEMRELHTRRIRDLQDSQPAGGVVRGEAGGGAVRSEAGGGPGRFAPRAIEQPEEAKKSQERLKELRDQLTKEVDNVLLPHQKKRLEEIGLRMKMKQRGTTGSLVDTELAKALDIGDAQKESIRRRAAEVQKELEAKIAKLREEAREEILSELTPEQQTKLKNLLGAEFDDKPQPVAPPRIRRPRVPAAEGKSEGKVEEKAEEKGATEPAPRGS